ncbi:MAG: AI-2E family transporter [Clostridia bacterium]|nr:AI-2E family transporter [Clostridia bacterium]
MANNKKWLKLLIALVILAAVVAVIIFALPPALRVIGYLAWLLMPFIVGYVFSLMANPLVNKMQQKLRLPRGVSAVIVIVLVLGIIGGICGFVVWKGIDEARSVYSNLPQIIENAQGGTQSLGEHLSGFIKNLPPNMQQSIMSVMENLSSRAGEIANTYLMPIMSRAGDMA